MKSDIGRYPYPRRHIVRFIIKNVARLAFASLTRLEVIGRENFPQQGPVLVVANHFHFADPAVVMRVLPRQIEFLGGGQGHMPNAPLVVQWLPLIWGSYPVTRGGVSRDAMRAAAAVFQQEGVVGIFPEAGSWATVLRPARPGTAFLATMNQVPLVPIGIHGMPNLFPAVRQRKRATVTIRIGKPFGPFHVVEKGVAKRKRLDDIGTEIMHHIATLIPPEYHGYYSTDPVLRKAAERVSEYPWDMAQSNSPNS
ncbi:MAG: lysophospholipid acyltransferase family protein [Chloroflexota bacterium]